MKFRNRLCVGLAASMLALASWAGPSLAAPFYEGKVLTVYAGTRPGTGVDTNFRILRPFLKKYTPGHPTMAQYPT